MKIRSMRLTNYRGFEDSGNLQFDRLNVLVGPNNAGKSSLIRALHLLQSGPYDPHRDVRIGASGASATLEVSELDHHVRVLGELPGHDGLIQITLPRAAALNIEMKVAPRGEERLPSPFPFPQQEPNHLIVPFLAKRKTAGYGSGGTLADALTVAPDLRTLPAKLQRLAQGEFPAGRRYRETCQAILGFVVTAILGDGLRAGVWIDETTSIALEDMGEGVPNIVGLLAELAVAKDKIFLIEEPESDIHPQALKALCDLIVQSAESNYFFVSTHSHIVLRHLGAAPGSTIHHVSAEKGTLPPLATAEPVSTDPAARVEILGELGYELYDFDLWDGWLLLEESSAERLIRDHLIPWFAPELRRVRTLSTQGNSQVEPSFADFNRLFRFTHLEARYRGRAWVVVDGDDEGREVVERLRENYGGAWDGPHFRCFSKPAFEYYYPRRFANQVDDALSKRGSDKRQAKRDLLDAVRAWISAEPELARDEFEESAAEVITLLRDIETTLFAKPNA